MINNYYETKEKAGAILAKQLENLDLKKPLILAVPRGGVEVAQAIADKFNTPIHIIVTKKLPLPQNPEVAFGAMSEDQINIIDKALVKEYDISKEEIDEIASKVNIEIKHRIKIYGRFNEELAQGAQVLIIDDGIATGNSLLAAVLKIKSMNPAEVIVASPVCTEVAYKKLSELADKVIAPVIDNSGYFSVSNYYQDFKNLSEDELLAILKKYKAKFE